MIQDDSVLLIENQRNFFKMTKTRTVMFLVVIVITCALIFSITDALPTPESESMLESDTKLGNNSRLVITNVVKTIEFEVGIVDEDDVVDENSTALNASEFYETDIQLLNVDLLKEVVNKADEDDNARDKQVQTPRSGNNIMEQAYNSTDVKIEKLTS